MKNKDILLDALGDAGEGFVPDLSVKTEKRSSIFKWISFGSICAAAIFCAVILPVIKHSETRIKDSASITADDNGLHIPAIQLPATSENANTEMIGLVVYQGRIYTQSGFYDGDEAQKILPLVGEHLGTAKGNIDEWSAQDDYATEFASTIGGEVYSVNGYDTGFRICICGEAEDENHNKNVWVNILDCLNGITLKNGSELFEDRLHVRERTETIQFQTHSDWNRGLNNTQIANVEPDIWNEFLDQVDNGAFIYTWDPGSKGNNTIYNTPHQAHIILSMNDGTLVELRLIDGGYVGYNAMAWCFVKIPEDIFNAVYDICGGTH